jgi:hypothetical protein
MENLRYTQRLKRFVSDNSPTLARTLYHRWQLQRNIRSSQIWDEITIGVTTYIERYDEWLVPLLTEGLKHSLDRKWIVAINGHKDSTAQDRYLNRFQTEWRHVARLTCLVHRRAVGVAQLWNEIIQASPTRYLLILNDDLTIFPGFWQWLASQQAPDGKLIKINNIWSHYLVDKALLDQLGYFDETLAEMGFEDTDFEGRMWTAGLSPGSIVSPYIQHAWEQPDDTSYESERVLGKYSKMNQDRFFEKWRTAAGGEPGLYFPRIDKTIVPNTDHLSYRPPAREWLRTSNSRWIDMEDNGGTVVASE